MSDIKDYPPLPVRLPSWEELNRRVANMCNYMKSYINDLDDNVHGDEYRLLDTSLDDLRFPATGNKLDSASTRYSFDLTDLGVSFDANARYTNEQLSYIVQLPHSWKEGTSLYPHIHWIQSQAAFPNWLMSYRVYNNNEAPGTWTNAIIDSSEFTWSSGDLAQISSFPAITMTGKTMSCLIDIKLWRDTANTSTELAGADPVATAVLLKELDIHYEIDSFGSATEYTK